MSTQKQPPDMSYPWKTFTPSNVWKEWSWGRELEKDRRGEERDGVTEEQGEQVGMKKKNGKERMEE